MRFNPFFLFFFCAFFSLDSYGSGGILVDNSNMEDLRIGHHSRNRAFEFFDRCAHQETTPQALPDSIRTGRGAPQGGEAELVSGWAQHHRGQRQANTHALEPYELSVLRGLFGDDFDPQTVSPQLIHACRFDPSERHARHGQKYEALGKALLSAGIIRTDLLERLALQLYQLGECEWTPLETSRGAIVNSSPVWYSVVLDRDKQDPTRILNRRVRFYFYNNDWDVPETSLTESPNLVTAQVNLNLVYRDGTPAPTISYTSRVLGNYVKNIDDTERRRLAGRAYRLSAQLYGSAAKTSKPQAGESDEILKSIVGANFVDMATSAAKMYRYAAHLESREALQRRHLTLSNGYLREAHGAVDFVRSYQHHVQEAYDRIQAFQTDTSLTEDQFVEDFRFVVGRPPQFALDRVEFNQLGDDADLNEYPSLKAWNELVEARTGGQSPDGVALYFEKLRGALDLDPRKLQLHYDRHMAYYNAEAFLASLQREQELNDQFQRALG